MAKAELKIDIKQGPALMKALLRMVGAFGAGVQAGTEQSAALIEAYTVIQNAMVSEAETLLPGIKGRPIRRLIESNDGNYADVVLKKGGEKLSGRIDCQAGKGWFFLRGNADNYVRLDEVEHVTIVKSCVE